MQRIERARARRPPVRICPDLVCMVRKASRRLLGMDWKALFDLPPDAQVPRADVCQLMNGCDPKTLGRWAKKGQFPAPARVGRSVFYRAGDLQDWLRSFRVVSVPIL